MTGDLPKSAIPVMEAELPALLLDSRRENWKRIKPESTQRRVVEDLIKSDLEVTLRPVEQYVAISSNSRILDLARVWAVLKCCSIFRGRL